MEVVKAALRLGLKAQSTIAISSEEGCHTYGQLLHSALTIASDLKAAFTIHAPKISQQSSTSKTPQRATLCANSGNDIEGERVGIIGKPCAEFVSGLWATWLCRGIAVPLALSHPDAELLHVLMDSDVGVVMGTIDHQSRLMRVAQKCSARFCLLPRVPCFEANVTNASETNGAPYEKVLAEANRLSTFEDQLAGLIIYTSGTTGKPKGVVHTHYSMNTQVPGVKGVWKRWSESYAREGAKVANAITVFTGVPSMYAYLLQGYREMDKDSQKVATTAAARLRLMMCGSSSLPQPVLRAWEELTRHRLLERYGMTEFMMALSNPYEGNRKPGTVGKPFPGVEVEIVKDDVNVLEAGELYVRSPSMFKEYWRQPVVTKETFDERGYFKTGDYATLDKDGYIRILGRKSVDILKVGGYKLSALEIEAVLLEHPSIAECAVLGLPDECDDSIIWAIVVLTKDASGKALHSVDLKELQEWVKERLAPYKVPSKLAIWESMPRNSMGKVNKQDLKEMVAAS